VHPEKFRRIGPGSSVHQTAKLVAALLRVARVTAGLAESYGSLPPTYVLFVHWQIKCLHLFIALKQRLLQQSQFRLCN